MLPLSDENLPNRGWAYAALAIIAINVLVFVLLQLPSDAFTYGWSAIPYEITRSTDLVGPVTVGPAGGRVTIDMAPGPSPIQLTLLTSMFMHGGWLHLLGNMLFLFIFGDNVEHAMGRLKFVGFYLIAGLVGALAQIAINADSQIPSLGASGAISGVLGAYLVMFPGNRVLVFLFRAVVWVPALLVIGLWALLQFVSGIGQIAVTEETGGVAYMAHIGGFVVGVVVGFLARGMASRST